MELSTGHADGKTSLQENELPAASLIEKVRVTMPQKQPLKDFIESIYSAIIEVFHNISLVNLYDQDPELRPIAIEARIPQQPRQ